MAYSPWRYSGDFATIQRLAGTLKIQAEQEEDEVTRAYLMGGADALYLLAPNIQEPTTDNVVSMMKSNL